MIPGVVSVYATNWQAIEGESVSAFVIWWDTYYDGGTNPSGEIVRGSSIAYAISGTASNGLDFEYIANNSVSLNAIPGNQFVIPIKPIVRAGLQGTRSVTLTLGGGGYTIDTNASSATIGIMENASTITITASDPYAASNKSGTFTISRSGGLNNPCLVNVAISGTAVAGSNFTTLPTSVTFAANQTITNLVVTPLTNGGFGIGRTVVLSLLTSNTYYLGTYTNAVVTILADKSSTSVVTPVGRYWRGSGTDPKYWSMVAPLDYQRGVAFDNLYGNCSALYPGILAWSGQVLYHFNATNTLSQTNVANRIAFNNPIVAFGERVGGTPLYLNQKYSFGVYAGNEVEVGAPVVISVYARSNSSYQGNITLTPPNIYDVNSWDSYVANGFQVTAQGFGLSTTLSDSPGMGWGIPSGNGAYILTHTATGQATNYYYLVTAYGYPPNQSTPMSLVPSGQTAGSLLYTLGFDDRPGWRSIFVDQPHFDGKPLPPFYAGKTVTELLTNTLPVTNSVTMAPSACTNIDGSPELRRHPILDQFVSDMRSDPIALANYVLNEIDLTDAMDYGDNGNIAEQSINLGGVSRGALGTFLEKQGSPTEQCALLVYLLRQAGVPASYLFAPHNGLQILDARLSRMLKFQVHGAFGDTGQPLATNTLIAANYPWVAAYVGTNWVHIFPWLKDYQIVEGPDLYDYMPTNYNNAYGWVKDYVYGNSNLLSLASDIDATPRVIFPKYLTQTLQQNHPGVSVDDLGVRVFNRRHNYSRWQDFPTPTSLTNSGTIAVESLTAPGITNVSGAMTNIFDTVSVEIYSVNSPNRTIQTGDLRLADLHNRKFYLSQTNTGPGQIQLNLVLAPYRTNALTQGNFTSDANLLGRQILSMTLDQVDDQLSVTQTSRIWDFSD